jgi:alkyldihydroxyacetonephosphate synthase
LIVLDEADPGLLEATLAVVDQECAAAEVLDVDLVGRWLEHRNDVSALAPLWRSGIVVDTAEVSARWAALPGLYRSVLDAVGRLEGTLVVSSHQSHAYTDGACLYFTFAGRPGPEGRAEDAGVDRRWSERYYEKAWDAVTEATREAGGAISHHHGIGLNRARFLPSALGPAFGVLAEVKQALDPHGILNPGKLGLASAFGTVSWP